jgi:hypothetical protein
LRRSSLGPRVTHQTQATIPELVKKGILARGFLAQAGLWPMKGDVDVDGALIDVWACPALTDTFARPRTLRRAGIRSLPD